LKILQDIFQYLFRSARFIFECRPLRENAILWMTRDDVKMDMANHLAGIGAVVA